MKTNLPIIAGTACFFAALTAASTHAADPAWPFPAKAVAGAAGETRDNTLTDAEKAAGWRLLFDGKSLAGWHNFKREGVRPGWQVKDGSLMCVDPHDAGDIVTRR